VRERLTRERIVDAALRIMDEEGLEAVSMRRVAREVGVEAMSLYHHVRDKEDLLDGVCARVMCDFRYPDEDRPWIEVARDGAREWRRVLREHPNVIALWAERQRPMTELEALMPMEFALRVIGRAGMEPREGVLVFNVIGGFIMGVVMMEVGAMFSAGTVKAGKAVDLNAVHPKLPDEEFASFLPPEQLPCLVAAVPHLAECDADEQFEYGLDLLLAGIQARVVTPTT
jgi:TetR/AcrR family transcriptional regulator, tetracycline repressor protein